MKENSNIKDGHTLDFWTKVASVTEFILNDPTYFKRNRYKDLVGWVSGQFNVVERQAKRYISAAKKDINEFANSNRDTALEYTLVQYKRMFVEAMKSGTVKDGNRHKFLKLALEILRDQNNLLNLYPEKSVKQDNINYDIDLNKLTEEGLERIKRGDDPRVVMLDSKCVRLEHD